MAERNRMTVSSGWLKASMVTFVFGFAILGYLAARIVSGSPPIPQQVQTAAGEVLFTEADIMAGQHVFQKYALMQYGTIYGHGAYLGPDFTAEALHRGGEAMLAFYLGQGLSDAEARARVERELKQNAYDAETGVLTFSQGQAHAFEQLVEYYRGWFGPGQRGLERPKIEDPAEIRRLSSFFTWAAWTSAALRPGTAHSYTNNWPPEPLAGNEPTGAALLWSVLSLVALLGGTGIVLFAFGR
jgi:nitric oxide reductase subunit B